MTLDSLSQLIRKIGLKKLKFINEYTIMHKSEDNITHHFNDKLRDSKIQTFLLIEIKQLIQRQCISLLLFLMSYYYYLFFFCLENNSYTVYQVVV
jgi:hypothetical protein